MNLLRRNPKDAPAGGLIACAGLAAWWSATFTPQEQQRIIASFGKFGAERGEALVNGSFPCSGTNTRQMLSLMASGLTDTPSRSMARRMMEKADSLPPEDIFGKHATLGVMIQLYYADRDLVPGSFDLAVRTCERLIAIAPEVSAYERKHWPNRALGRNLGFEQLAIIREKEKNFAEAIRLSEAALSQGWAGEWEKRIARCGKALERANQPPLTSRSGGCV